MLILLPPRHAVLLAALIAVLAGCGDGEGRRETAATPRTTTTSGPSKEDFIAQGDRLCAELRVEGERIAARGRRIRRSGGPEAVQRKRAVKLWRDQSRLIADFRTRFKALEAPRGDEKRIRELHRTLDDAVVLSRRIAWALEAGGNPRRLVRAYSGAVYLANVLAEAYGFNVCGSAAPRA